MITAFFKPKNGGKQTVKAKDTGETQPGPTESPSTSLSTVSTASPPSSAPRQAPADDHRKRSNPYLRNDSRRSATSSNAVVASSSATSSSKRPKTSYNNDGSDTAVAAIVSALDDDIDESNEDEGDANNFTWKKSLNKHFTKPNFVRLAKFVQSERYVCTSIHPSVA